MKPDHRFSPPAVGGSSLLAIFAVLTISIFALLTLSTVQAERRLSDSSAQSVTAYYRADLAAETVFAQLRSGETPPQVERDGEIYRYTCPISETQLLYVELRHAGENWQVLRWQAIPLNQLPEDQTLPIWDGTMQQGGTP